MNGLKLLSDIKFYNDYSKYSEEFKRKKTWNERVDDVMDMHRTNPKFQNAFKNPKFVELFDFADNSYKNRYTLASQRTLQFAGKPIMSHNSRLYNCLTSYCDRAEVFQEAMYWLLSGCGVGVSFVKEHVAKLPKIYKRNNGAFTFVIPDSIEGWSDAIGVMISSYMKEEDAPFPDYSGYEVRFDYSLIRPKGSFISGGFKAPGHEGLKQSLEKIENLLERNINNNINYIKPIVAYDILMFAADAVLSGGVRRSATIAIFSPDDEEMMNAKTGNWFSENPQRARSNNSALLIRNKTPKELFERLMKSTKEFGEPGFVFADTSDVVYNPCFHPDTRLATDNGLIQIKELFIKGLTNNVVIDKRARKGNLLELNNLGVDVKPASEVKLTQKQANVFKLTTEHGYELKVTDNHEIPTKRGRLKLKDMVIGDTILLQSAKGKFGVSGNYNQGLILGMITGDGCELNSTSEAFVDIWGDDLENKDFIKDIINTELKQVTALTVQKYNELDWMKQTSIVDKLRIGGRRLYRLLHENMNIDNDFKNTIPEIVWQGSEEMVKGYIQGLIYSDDSVQCTGKGNKATLSVRINQSNKNLLDQVQILLLNFGIVSRVYLRRTEGETLFPDGNGGKKMYKTKANYELVINRPNAIKLLSEIGLYGKKLKTLTDHLDILGYDCYKPERYISKLVSVEFDSVQDVYCLYQDETNTVIANGLVVGQCVEIGMIPRTKDYRSGWQGCNLCEINGGKMTSEAVFYDACKAAAILGTIQAAYTDFKYVSSVSKEIFDYEALLGVSITGFMNNPKILLNPEILKKGANIVKETNAIVAKMIGIRPAARTTCVKPSGNASVLLETTSGIHGEHAPRFFRVMQINKQEEIAKYIFDKYPDLMEESVWSATNADYALFIPVVAKKDSIFKHELLGIKQLEAVKLVQQTWVEEGTNIDLCIEPYLRHNVSNTVSVDNWDDVTEYIWENQRWFAGISLMANSGDKAYNQAPFTKVLLPTEIIEQYGDAALVVSGLIVDGLHLFENNLWKACDAISSRDTIIDGTRTQVLLKKDWLLRAKKFGKKYFKNTDELISCMKDVSLYHKWMKTEKMIKNLEIEDILKNIKPEYVDADTLGAVACSGPGGCDITRI